MRYRKGLDLSVLLGIQVVEVDVGFPRGTKRRRILDNVLAVLEVCHKFVGRTPLEVVSSTRWPWFEPLLRKRERSNGR